MTEKNWTPKQDAFLDALVELGDLYAAKHAAGYAKETKMRDLINTPEMETEIKKRLAQFLAIHGSKAAHALVDIIDNPAQMGGAVKRGAATDILDRIGLSKQDSLEISVKAPDGVLVLPAKKEVEVAESSETEA